MRKLVLLIFLSVFANTSFSQAGVAGWLTAEKRDWDFVQKTGGIRIEPVERKVYYQTAGDPDKRLGSIEIK